MIGCERRAPDSAGHLPDRFRPATRPVIEFSYNFRMCIWRAQATPQPRQTGILIARSPLAARSWAGFGFLLLLLLASACGRSPGVPDSSADASQKLPFDREPPSTGTSPTKVLVPPNRIPEGTSLTVRLAQAISSASIHAGDSFEGALDDPVVIADQTLLPRGARVKGRVLDAKASSAANDPGYLRIVLVSVDVRGNNIPIDSSSIFAKAPVLPPESSPGGSGHLADVAIPADRRLTFRLAHFIDLP